MYAGIISLTTIAISVFGRLVQPSFWFAKHLGGKFELDILFRPYTG